MTISSGSGLSDAGFLILASLADRPRHGLGVIEDVETRTGGAVRLGPGAVYGTLKRLREGGLIEQVDDPPDPGDDDPRRRYYRITPGGRRAVRTEVDHLLSLVDLVRGKDLLPDRR